MCPYPRLIAAILPCVLSSQVACAGGDTMPASGNPYLALAPQGTEAANPSTPGASVVGEVERVVSPWLGSLKTLPETAILPTFRTVYPTGEKPLLVVSFKCPTELVGVAPPSTKLLHHAVDMGMAGINRTGLLSFNLQQVCS